MIGKDVKIIVVEEPAPLDSIEPAPLDSIPASVPLKELAGNIGLDFDAIEKLREISKT